MRIISFTAENYKRLTVVSITPTGAVVDIVGKNGAGKSSVLDGLYAALAGKSAIPSKPIRNGADHARIELKLGTGEKVDLIVRRTFARNADDSYTTSVVVETASGAVHKSPQTLLDGLMGSLSFDPLAFARMEPKEQLLQLRKLVPGVDFEALDKSHEEDFSARTLVNRQVKSTAAQLAAIVVPGDPRQVRVDESALVADLEAAGEMKAAIVKEENDRQSTLRQIDDDRERARNKRALALVRHERIEKMRAEIVSLERLVAEDEATAKSFEEEADELEAAFDALPPVATPPDTSALKARIDAARKTNADVDERDRVIADRAKLDEAVKSLEARSASLTKRIADRNEAKTAAIQAAHLPIDGLSFGDNEALFNGLPLDQASDAERLRVSVAIAAALNPKLRVIRVRDGSLLDTEGLALLGAFAEGNDLQVWLERVADASAVGFVIEDGHVRVEEEAAA